MRVADSAILAPTRDVAGQVTVLGVGEADHSRASGRAALDMSIQAAERALDDAGLTPSDVDGIASAPMPGQLDAKAFRRHFKIERELWETTEGGVSPLVFQAAARALRAGEATCILNTYGVAWASERTAMVGGPGDAHAREPFKRSLEVPFGWFPQPVYFATVARRHMHEYGTTREHLGAVAVATRANANRTSSAVMHDRPLSLQQYLGSPMIADPFTRNDCCLISDGAGALVLTDPERSLDGPHPVVEVAGVATASWATGWHFAQQQAFTATPQSIAAPAAFEMADVRPSDLDVYQCYDPFTILTIMQLEDSGFCEKGEGGPFAASVGLDAVAGGLPTNTHGGLLSHAYIMGIGHVIELVRQLRHDADAQVRDAELGAYGHFTGGSASTLVLRRAR